VGNDLDARPFFVPLPGPTHGEVAALLEQNVTSGVAVLAPAPRRTISLHRCSSSEERRPA
jgi:hypothetical protein